MRLLRDSPYRRPLSLSAILSSMPLNLTYHHLIGSESCGQHGAFGFRVQIAHKGIDHLFAGRRDLDNETELEKAIFHAGYDAEKLIQTAVMTYVVSNDPQAQKRRVAERAQLVGLFPAGCFVEEIPNGYCSDWCCKHLPWFIVTAPPVGRITIGWRKSVMHLEWKGTVGTKTAEELFPKDNVTKGDFYIHAHSIEDAQRYINVVIASAAPTP